MPSYPQINLDVPFSSNSIPSTGKYLYSENDFRFRFYQPNLVRWRHQFRSPRSSLRINQEIGQTNFDIYNLDKKKDSLRKTAYYYLDNIMNGWNLDGEIQFHNGSAETPSTIDAELVGLSNLFAKVESIRTRIRNLER